MSSVILLSSEESAEQQNAIRKRSLFPIKDHLSHLDIDNAKEADDLTSLTHDFLSVTKHLTHAEISELSGAALEEYATEFLETRCTFGGSGNTKVGDRFWPTGQDQKRLTYAEQTTRIKEGVKGIMVNQCDNKSVTIAKNLKRQRNEAAGVGLPVPEGSISRGSTPNEASRSSSKVEQGGGRPESGAAHIPIITETSPLASTPRTERSATLDWLPSPVSFRSPSPNVVNETSDQQNAPKRRKPDPAETAESKNAANVTAGTAAGYVVSPDAPFGPSGVQSPDDQASIDACYSKAWDEAVSTVRVEVDRYIAEINRSRAEAEAVGLVRKTLSCDHKWDALQELLCRVLAEKGKKKRR